MAPSRKLVKIEGHVDLICAWCYLQKRSLDVAIQNFRTKYPEWDFEVIWRPFLLNPNIEPGLTKRELYDKYFPQSPTARIRLRFASSKHGILFCWMGGTGSPRNAHVLSRLVLERLGATAQGRVVEQLFAGHFEHGRDISKDEWLVQVGCQAGLDEEVVREVLQSAEAAHNIDEEARKAKSEAGIGAVPCVTVQGRYRVGGYQEEGVFEAVFDKIRVEVEASSQPLPEANRNDVKDNET